METNDLRFLQQTQKFKVDVERLIKNEIDNSKSVQDISVIHKINLRSDNRAQSNKAANK